LDNSDNGQGSQYLIVVKRFADLVTVLDVGLKPSFFWVSVQGLFRRKISGDFVEDVGDLDWNNAVAGGLKILSDIAMRAANVGSYRRDEIDEEFGLVNSRNCIGQGFTFPLRFGMSLEMVPARVIR
jgi:hypothetical protein